MLDYRTHTFLTVCRLASYTRAAEELHITQPAVSQHIRQLEHHYGCTLFSRAGRGVALTPAGEVLFRDLSTLENDERRIREQVAAIGDERASIPLRFGCTRTIGDFAAPRLLAAHLARRPHDRILMRSGNTAELVRLIERGEIDFALVEGTFDHATFDSAPLSRERYIAVADKGAPPASVSDLLGRRLILREPGSGTREILEHNLAARGLSTADFAERIELSSIPAIKDCVRAGAGITFLYRIAVEDELREGSLVDITPRDFSIDHDFALIWQRGSLYADRYRALLRTWNAWSRADRDSGRKENGS